LFPRAARGVGGFLGIDIGRNIAISEIQAGRRLGGGDDSALQEVVDISFGPFAKDALVLARDVAPALVQKLVRVSVGDSRSVMTRQERARAARQLAPVMVRRIMDAYRIASEGIVRQPTTGRPIFEPENPREEAAFTLFGLRTIERAERDRELSTIRRIAEQQNRDRRDFVHQIIEARDEGNRERERQLRREASSRGIVITNDMIQRADAEIEQAVVENALERLPRRLRRGVRRRVQSRLNQ